MSVNPASVTNPPAQFPEDFVFGGATAAYQVEGETRTHGKPFELINYLHLGILNIFLIKYLMPLL